MRTVVSALLLCMFAGPLHAGNSAPGAISTCTKLLPEGKTYTFTIKGTARHETAKTIVNTNVEVESRVLDASPNKGDDEKEAKAFGKEIEAFQQCMNKSL